MGGEDFGRVGRDEGEVVGEFDFAVVGKRVGIAVGRKDGSSAVKDGSGFWSK